MDFGLISNFTGPITQTCCIFLVILWGVGVGREILLSDRLS